MRSTANKSKKRQRKQSGTQFLNSVYHPNNNMIVNITSASCSSLPHVMWSWLCSKSEVGFFTGRFYQDNASFLKTNESPSIRKYSNQQIRHLLQKWNFLYLKIAGGHWLRCRFNWYSDPGRSSQFMLGYQLLHRVHSRAWLQHQGTNQICLGGRS